MSYFESGSTLPPPFNIIPTVKCAVNLLTRLGKKGKNSSEKYKNVEDAQHRHQDIMRCIVKR